MYKTVLFTTSMKKTVYSLKETLPCTMIQYQPGAKQALMNTNNWPSPLVSLVFNHFSR